MGPGKTVEMSSNLADKVKSQASLDNIQLQQKAADKPSNYLRTNLRAQIDKPVVDKNSKNRLTTLKA